MLKIWLSLGLGIWFCSCQADSTASDSDTGSDTGTDTGSDTGSDTDADTGADTGTDTETGSDTGSDMGTDTETGSDTDSGSDVLCVCDESPENTCSDLETLREYASPTCVDDTCIYDYADVHCEFGCVDEACLETAVETPACVRYVDIHSTSSTANGVTWETAFPHLQPAIAAAAALRGSCAGKGEIWVAAGRYHIWGAGQDSGAQTDYLILKDSIAIYGGFTGVELLLSQRDVSKNPTILDGSNPADDTQHVFHIAKCKEDEGCGANVTIDGLVFTGGHAIDDDGSPNNLGEDECGGAIYTDQNITVNNCTFTDNAASRYSGAIFGYDTRYTVTNSRFVDNTASFGGALGGYQYGADATITGCTFVNNSVAYRGGAISFGYGSPTINNCVFIGNSAGSTGGAISVYLYMGSQTISNCSFSNNSATKSGGAIHNNSAGSDSTLDIVNCAMYNNLPQSINDDSWVGDTPEVTTNVTNCISNDTITGANSVSNTIVADPLFIDPTNDLHLQPTSLAIDNGDDSFAPETDFDGNNRSGTSDIGAFEHQP